MRKKRMRIAILGGGPAALFMYKRFIECGRGDLEIDIFERNQQLGSGMPYSLDGANEEHITNVSDNEIPRLVISIEEWLKIAPEKILSQFNITPENFREFKVLPRLFFGQYLSSQFELLQGQARKTSLVTKIHLHSSVTDLIDQPGKDEVWVEVSGNAIMKFDRAIICTGHHWPVVNEGRIRGYYDSPYPPSKLRLILNHPVAIKGASLTAIDTIRTLARNNGNFIQTKDGQITYARSETCPEFKMVMHSVEGLLPALRFHLEDSRPSGHTLLTPGEVGKQREENDGFLPLDFVFEKKFKEILRDKDPDFYRRIKNKSLEEFVDLMMDRRERADPFKLFRAEYAEAERSIRRRESIYWKELLATLSFELNYSAKYLSAEDMQRLTQVLMPLISIVIALVPQSSGKELLALHDAGVLELVSVDAESEVIPEEKGGVTYKYTDESGELRSIYYKTFINSTGQPKLAYEQFPFKSLLRNGTISPARIRFRSQAEGRVAASKGDGETEADANGNYYLKVPGVTINDNFQVVDEAGNHNKRIFIMAVPYIGGYNPDYSGLDFCEAASRRIVEKVFDQV